MIKVDLCGVKLINPVIAASGCFAFGREMDQYIDLKKIGGISTSGITIQAKEGNKGIRIYETPSGLMNSIGLQNPSVEVFLEEEFEAMKKLGPEVIVNLGGNELDHYLDGAKLLEKADFEIIELNISCPNLEEGGLAFGMDCDSAAEVVKAVKEISTKKIMVKLTPNAGDLVGVAQACQEAGADALSLVNTFNALAIDIYKRKPVFKNVTAGLSGPAIKPMALRMVRDVARAVDIPVVGIGGISTWQDAIEFIMAGSTAIQVGTANFVDLNVMEDIAAGIESFMKNQGINDLSEIRGII